MFVHCCHCRDCQRQTGSAFVINALIETERITCSRASSSPCQCRPTAAARTTSIAAPSAGPRVERLWRPPRAPLRARGHPRRCRRLPPDVHIYTRSKLPWVSCRRRARVRGLLRHEDALARGKSGAPTGHPGTAGLARRVANGEHHTEAATAGTGRAAFLALYGPVYEHSPWIAEAVFDFGLTEDHRTAEGLQAAMAAVVEAAPQARRLALLRAHPDLAGRLAIRGELTPQSAAEQAGAGLGDCSPAEFQRFRRSTRLTRPSSAFPSSWRSKAAAAPRSWRPSNISRERSGCRIPDGPG